MGWAALLGSGDVQSGFHHHKGDVNARLGSYLRWLRDSLPTQVLVVERPQGLQGRAVDSLFGFLGVSRAVADEAGIAFLPVSPTQVKKAATGNGRASKVEVQDAVEEWFGIECETDDEADALAILKTWMDRSGES